MPVKKMYTERGADVVARFPGIIPGTTFEHFYRYYQRHVTAELDTTTNISYLKVTSFAAADSKAIAEALLAASENMVNRMNERQRANLIRSSEREVAQAEVDLRQVSARLAQFRNDQALLDPTKQSVPMLKDVEGLKSLLSTTQVQVAQLKATAPESPLLKVYEERIRALNGQIQYAGANITGTPSSLVPKITQFDELTIERQLSEKKLQNAVAALEAAKIQADRQLLYLERITEPNAPDYAEYPRRGAWVAISLLTFAGLYAMGHLLVVGIREHQLT